ncbi:hypothetical protein J7L60_01990 [Candidatus Bathyarchaeota archaeon]|nr:hypothetical protein [Candidatus Bathyarchaeota archaeon]
MKEGKSLEEILTLESGIELCLAAAEEAENLEDLKRRLKRYLGSIKERKMEALRKEFFLEG